VSGCLAVALAVWVVVAGEVPGELRVLVRLHDAGDRVMLAISRSSELVPLAVIALGALVALLVRRRQQVAAYFVAGVAVVWSVNPVLKEIVGRSRPDLWPLPASVSEYGFPSGHAANTAALAGALVMICRGRRARVMSAAAAAVVLVAVGLSQLVLGRHYPSDILAGWLWAGAWISLVRFMHNRR
jgi:membrane-associated phospholipid phosphatase